MSINKSTAKVEMVSMLRNIDYYSRDVDGIIIVKMLSIQLYGGKND